MIPMELPPVPAIVHYVDGDYISNDGSTPTPIVVVPSEPNTVFVTPEYRYHRHHRSGLLHSLGRVL